MYSQSFAAQKYFKVPSVVSKSNTIGYLTYKVILSKISFEAKNF